MEERGANSARKKEFGVRWGSVELSAQTIKEREAGFSKAKVKK